ncbi:hypothetical protein IJ541_11745, partial [bacterium]|nr:hypothetical protein [bacterium]
PTLRPTEGEVRPVEGEVRPDEGDVRAEQGEVASTRPDAENRGDTRPSGHAGDEARISSSNDSRFDEFNFTREDISFVKDENLDAVVELLHWAKENDYIEIYDKSELIIYETFLNGVNSGNLENIKTILSYSGKDFDYALISFCSYPHNISDPDYVKFLKNILDVPENASIIENSNLYTYLNDQLENIASHKNGFKIANDILQRNPKKLLYALDFIKDRLAESERQLRDLTECDPNVISNIEKFIELFPDKGVAQDIVNNCFTNPEIKAKLLENPKLLKDFYIAIRDVYRNSNQSGEEIDTYSICQLIEKIAKPCDGKLTELHLQAYKLMTGKKYNVTEARMGYIFSYLNDKNYPLFKKLVDIDRSREFHENLYLDTILDNCKSEDICNIALSVIDQLIKERKTYNLLGVLNDVVSNCQENSSILKVLQEHGFDFANQHELLDEINTIINGAHSTSPALNPKQIDFFFELYKIHPNLTNEARLHKLILELDPKNYEKVLQYAKKFQKVYTILIIKLATDFPENELLTFFASDSYMHELKQNSAGKYQQEVIDMFDFGKESDTSFMISILNSNMTKEDFLNAVKKMSKSTFKLAYDRPNQYLSGIKLEYSTPVDGKLPTLPADELARERSAIKAFFKENFVTLARILKYVDTDTVSHMMDKRTDLFEKQIEELNQLTDDNFQLLSRLLGCKSEPSGKPLSPKEKIQLCQVMEIYQNAGIDISELSKAASEGKLDLNRAKQVIQDKILERAGVDPNDRSHIKNDKKFNEEFSYLALVDFSKEAEEAIERELVPQFTQRIEQWRKSEQARQKYIDEINEQINDPLFAQAITPEARTNMEEIIDMIKNIEKYSDEEILNRMVESVRMIVTQFTKTEELYTVIRESVRGDFHEFITDESNKYGRTNAQTRQAFERNGLDYEKWLNPEIEDLQLEVAGKKMSIRMWERNPQEDLFMGNKTTCCTAIGTGPNAGATPVYLLNTSYNVVELFDADGNVVGMSRVFMGMVNGKPALMMDNIELNKTFVKGMGKTGKTAIRDAFFEYMNQYAAQVTGDPEAQVYFYGGDVHVPTSDLEHVDAKTGFIGELSQDRVYVNAAQCSWVDPKRLEDIGEIDWIIVPRKKAEPKPDAEVKESGVTGKNSDYSLDDSLRDKPETKPPVQAHQEPSITIYGEDLDKVYNLHVAEGSKYTISDIRQFIADNVKTQEQLDLFKFLTQWECKNPTDDVYRIMSKAIESDEVCTAYLALAKQYPYAPDANMALKLVSLGMSFEQAQKIVDIKQQIVKEVRPFGNDNYPRDYDAWCQDVIEKYANSPEHIECLETLLKVKDINFESIETFLKNPDISGLNEIAKKCIENDIPMDKYLADFASKSDNHKTFLMLMLDNKDFIKTLSETNENTFADALWLFSESNGNSTNMGRFMVAVQCVQEFYNGANRLELDPMPSIRNLVDNIENVDIYRLKQWVELCNESTTKQGISDTRYSCNDSQAFELNIKNFELVKDLPESVQNLILLIYRNEDTHALFDVIDFVTDKDLTSLLILSRIQQKIPMNLGLCEYVLRHIDTSIEISDERINLIAKKYEGCDFENNDICKRILVHMFKATDEQFAQYSKWFDYAKIFTSPTLEYAMNIQDIFYTATNFIRTGIPTSENDYLVQFETLMNNKEILDALRNHEILIDRFGLMRYEALPESEILRPEDCGDDFTKQHEYKWQQKYQSTPEVYENMELSTIMEGLFTPETKNDYSSFIITDDGSTVVVDPRRTLPIDILNKYSKAEINRAFDTISAMKTRMKNSPELYFNGDTPTEYVNYYVNIFFEKSKSGLLKLALTMDKEAIDLLMRKRFEDFDEYLTIINDFSPIQIELLQDLSKCCTLDGKPLMPTQKVDFIDLIQAYQDNHMDLSKIYNMAKSGKVDIGELQKDLFYNIMRNSGLSKEEIASIPPEIMMGWDFKYMHLLSKEINTEGDLAFSHLLHAANLGDFDSFIHNENNVYGQSNARTREMYSELGMNYEKWLKPSKENEIHFQSKDANLDHLSKIASDLTADIETLRSTPVKGYFDKLFSKYIKDGQFVIPTEILSNKTKLKEFTDSIISQLDAVWKRAKSNLDNPQRANQARGTLTVLDHLRQRVEDIAQVRDTKTSRSYDLTIRMWERNPQKDIFQGNYSTCCIGMGRGNGSAMPHYIMNTSFNMIELVDNATGKTLGNALCYFVKGADGKPMFIIDNIEIANSSTPSIEVGIQIRDAITQYASNVAKEVTGSDDVPIYMSACYNDVPITDLQAHSETVSFWGEMDCDEIYFDLFGQEGCWIDRSDLTSEVHLLRLK